MRLHLIRSGRARYVINGESIAMRRGTVIYVNPGSSLQLIADNKAPPRIISCRFGIHDNTSAAPMMPTTEAFHLVERGSDMPTLRTAVFTTRCRLQEAG